jgi:hypothetical protein
LVDGIAKRSVHDRDMRHAHGQFVHVLDPRAARLYRHDSTVGRDEDATVPAIPNRTDAAAARARPATECSICAATANSRSRHPRIQIGGDARPRPGRRRLTLVSRSVELVVGALPASCLNAREARGP